MISVGSTRHFIAFVLVMEARNDPLFFLTEKRSLASGCSFWRKHWSGSHKGRGRKVMGARWRRGACQTVFDLFDEVEGFDPRNVEELASGLPVTEEKRKLLV
ncbi:hypothetical protein CRG98_028718 [Punica granatum]|uniref:Uncharacterized protein n=1 Tax=Punica granatum TaxID=22663 RepID=A0A2I0J4Q2_PUNGR|nr:hypothetical protein CRG98_028718 [Punica granatum]